MPSSGEILIMSPTKRSAAEFLPSRLSYQALSKSAQACEGCDLFRDATQTVFGEGPTDAQIVIVGEQPGDQEDRQGHPFVGPAGRLLDESLEVAGIDRSLVYVTNAVKHFKFTQQGKRRLHKKPGSRELSACRPWIEAELKLIEPTVVLCLGATAAQSLMGKEFRITRQRGIWQQTPWCDYTLATYHPAALLRAPKPSQREAMREAFLTDLQTVRKRLD
jgi:uracil-DNA glycosylase